MSRATLVIVLVLMSALLSACDGPAPGCHYALDRAGLGAIATGTASPGRVAVTAPAGCAWASEAHDSWITLSGGTSGSGNGAQELVIAANPGVRRVGTVTIAFQTFTIDQAGTDGAGACTFTVYPPEVTVTSAGGPGAFAVVASAPDCSWFAEATAFGGEDDLIDREARVGIGNGIDTYEFVPGTFLPTSPPPRSARILVRNSAGVVAAQHRVTQTP